MLNTNPFRTLLETLYVHKASADVKISCYNVAINYRQKDLLRDEDYDVAGFNRLHWAIITDQREEVKLQLKSWPCVNKVTKHSPLTEKCCITPMGLAAIHGNAYIVSYLLTQDADINIVSQKHYIEKSLLGKPEKKCEHIRPFDEAANREHHEIVKLLAPKEAQSLYNEELKTAKDDIPTCFCLPVNTHQDKLAAIRALQTAIRGYTDINELKTLPYIHPALNEGRLSHIYNAYVAAKSHSDRQILEIDDTCQIL